MAGGIVGVGAFLIGIPGPLNGLMNTDLALLFAYLVSAFFFVVVSLTDKNGQEANRVRRMQSGGGMI